MIDQLCWEVSCTLLLSYFNSKSAWEHVRRMTWETPTCQHLGIKAKDIFFWDPLFTAYLGSKVQTVKTLTNVKRTLNQGRNSIIGGGKKKHMGSRLTARQSLEGSERSGMLYFALRGSQISSRNMELEKQFCFQTLKRLFFFFFPSGCIIPFINELNFTEKWCRWFALITPTGRLFKNIKDC